MEEKGIKKLRHMHRRDCHLASGAVSKSCCVLQKYEKGLENTQLREEISISILFSVCSSEEFLIQYTDLRILDTIPQHW